MVCGSGKNVGCHRSQNLYFTDIIVLQRSIFSSLFSFSSSLSIFCGGAFSNKVPSENHYLSQLCGKEVRKRDSFPLGSEG